MIRSKEYPELFNSWSGARARCYNVHSKDYPRYGGRGIKMSGEWTRFKDFLEWALENGWRKGLSLDRIDNDGDYGPNNCRWINNKGQANNRRNNVSLTVLGERKTCRIWSNITGIPHTTISMWIRHLGVEEACRRIEEALKFGYKGETYKNGLVVVCVSTGKSFSSTRKACEFYGLERKTMTKYIGTGIPYKGYLFEYAESMKSA